MKKEKQESPIKAARKKTRDAIEARLVKTLKTIGSELGQEAVDIEKEAKKLAKKLTKGLKKGKQEDKSNAPAVEAKKPAKESSDAKPKTVAKPVVPVAKKPVAKATAPKVVAAKVTTPKSTKK
jgi:hypothetical protein